MVRDIIPWRRGKDDGKLIRRRQTENHPFEALHREMDRLFDDFFGQFESGLGWPGRHALRSPADACSLTVDVAENDKEVRITADVPGIEEKDIDVELSDNVLTLSGEKRLERDEKEADYHVVERAYGAFHRAIPLPSGLIESEARAKFKNGVLQITIPKSPEAKTTRKQIPIEAS